MNCALAPPVGLDPDWSGYVYPTPRGKDFHEASYLANFFDTIEINTSFYQPLRPDHALLWIERVASNPAFLFTAKLWQHFTHEPMASAEENVRSFRLRCAGQIRKTRRDSPAISVFLSQHSGNRLSSH